MKLSQLVTRAALASLTILGLSTAAGSASAATTVTVAAPNGNSPYIINTDHGASGYYGELIKRIDRDLPQYKFKTTFTSQNAVFAGLQSGKYDVAMSNFWYNKQRFNNYYHTRANGLDDLRLVERKNGKKANSLAEVVKKKLTVVPVSTSDARYSLLENYNQQHPNNKLNLKGIGDQTTGDALKQVAQGKYDVAVYPYAAYKSVQTTSAGKNLTASKSIGLESSYFLLHKSPANKKLTQAMNKELQKLHDDGYLEKLTNKYLYENTFKLPGAQKEFNAHN
ncbi:MAG: transporter substrate-binding domain-containing protein [Limosilactobacillus sp.]|uniref:transporter substrate-binding domain-containing protein n=1 Tax=Limosilactobacillus sp. TaxID=2773925 RepID=UPI002A74EE01|nr:transporter substrate-binding domain-containing protein [Limosilactobacillus sp.]MDD7692765.1 transporter substrate-binding domain-containing protein [Lactobacillaceae bacterium]MDY2803284.1 transporter substrate-binding domain-containing protein [Limosilactobacillus sp.]